MAAIENEHIYGIQIRESADDGSDFTNPDADYRKLFLGEDGDLHLKDSSGTVTDIESATAHIADTTDAHDASAVSFDPTGLGNTSATEVQTALEDFDAAISAAGGGGGITRTTQGTTSAGASFQGARGVYLKKLTLASAGLVASICAHVKGDGTNMQGLGVVVFADSAGVPTNVIATAGASGIVNDSSAYDTNLIMNTTARDVCIPVGIWLAAGDYWFGVRMFGGGDNLILLAYSSGTGSDRTQSPSGRQSVDHSISAGATGTNDHTIYINVLR